MKNRRKPSSKLRLSVDSERRKRLGQYFTGPGLGRLLAALAQAEEAKTIIDPMVGSGDLLQACLGVDAKPEVLAGIEIDSATFNTLQTRLPEAKCLRGSAFDPELLSRLPRKSWDLVIANPPYVRYQSYSGKIDSPRALPGAMQIRTGLLQAIELFAALDHEDKRLFTHLVSGYSGLSDLAVPSWILCAALVRPGGRLALVAPESWLSRDYAAIVHYLLLRWFEIEFVVEDEHASWFEDAQVKTMLLVAKRVQRRSSALSWHEDAHYCSISISAKASTQVSPIGRLALRGEHLERGFARKARTWLRNASVQTSALVRARPASVRLACANMAAAASRQKWFRDVGEQADAAEKSVYIPHSIHQWITSHGIKHTFSSFANQAVAVGQGLRTGANGFFYADGTRSGEEVHLSFSGPLAGYTASAPLSIARPVLRKQAELPDGFVLEAANSRGWVLDLRGHVLPEHAAASRDMISTPYSNLSQGLAEIVRAAERENFGTAERPVKIWELTAVAPNIRPAASGAPPRYWYMLPDFAPRHLPDVLVARVNAGTPKAYLNPARSSLVDANFSTIWTLPFSRWTARALLALLNSSWSQAVIECTGAVMGGGALKVEATHLRRFPVPNLTDDGLTRMGKLGEILEATRDAGEATQVLAMIDAVISEALKCGMEGTSELKAIALAGRIQRAKHNGRRKGDGDSNVH